MLTNEQIEQNKIRFLSLVETIDRDGMDKSMLLRQLKESDFFYAPASVSHHSSYPGGLCEHSLRVFDNLVKLVNDFYGDADTNDSLRNTVKIISLFHDFSKMNYYTTEIKNKKVYSETGTKQDSSGRYDWVQVNGYYVKPAEERFGIGTPAENSVYMINTFIPLTQMEYAAILNHLEHDEVAVLSMWKKYPLSLLLHQADCIASFIQESYE